MLAARSHDKKLQRTAFGGAAQIVVTVGLLVAAGCGEGRPTRVKVSGQVLIDGRPLEFGHVRFVPTAARSSEGTIAEDGRFVLSCYEDGDGAVPGVHRVAVAAGEPLSATQMRWHAPKKYADFTTSGLEQEITGPTDSVVIELKGEDGKPFRPFVDGQPPVKSSNDKTPQRGRE